MNYEQIYEFKNKIYPERIPNDSRTNPEEIPKKKYKKKKSNS